MSDTARLYTPELLASAVELASWPPIENAQLHGDARSAACGSTIGIDLLVDGEERIATIGMRVRACAVGQAAAAIFARHAHGLTAGQIRAAHDRMAGWLEEEAPAPDWPGIALIAPARAFPARHGAMLLPWKAALAALSSAPAAS